MPMSKRGGARYIDYIEFISDMLGGDLLPLNRTTKDLRKVISSRAIDYELMRSILNEVQTHNMVFQLNDKLKPYPTLDALGKVRGNLLLQQGDIHQISLIDRMGEITVSFFNLPLKVSVAHTAKAAPCGQIYRLN